MADITAVRLGTADGLQHAPAANMRYSFVSDNCSSNMMADQLPDASNISTPLPVDSSRIPCRAPQPLCFDPSDIEQGRCTLSDTELEQQRSDVEYLDGHPRANLPSSASNPIIKSEISEKAVECLCSNMTCPSEQNFEDFWSSANHLLANIHQAMFEQSRYAHYNLQSLKSDYETKRLIEVELMSQIQTLKESKEAVRLTEAGLKAEIARLQASMAEQLKLLDEKDRSCTDLQSELSRCERKCSLEKDQRIDLELKIQELQKSMAQMTSSADSQSAQIKSMSEHMKKLQAASFSSERKRMAAQKEIDSQEALYEIALGHIKAREEACRLNEEVNNHHKKNAQDFLSKARTANKAASDSDQLCAFALKALCDGKGRDFSVVEMIAVFKELQCDEELIDIFRSRPKQYLEWANADSTIRVLSKRQRVPQQTHGGEKAKKARIETQKQPLG